MSQASKPHSELLARAARQPLGVDISDYSDEFCAGFLAGQVNALEESGLLEQLEACRTIVDAARELPEFFHTPDGRVHSFVPLLDALSNPAKEPDA